MPRDQSGLISEGGGPDKEEGNWRACTSSLLPCKYGVSVTRSDFSRRVRNLAFR